MTAICWNNVDSAFMRTNIPLLPQEVDFLCLTKVDFSCILTMNAFLRRLVTKHINALTFDECIMTYVGFASVLCELNYHVTKILAFRKCRADDSVCMQLVVYGGDEMSQLDLSSNPITSYGLTCLAHLHLDSLDVSLCKCVKGFNDWHKLFGNVKRTLKLAGCFHENLQSFHEACEQLSGGEWTLDELDLSYNSLGYNEISKLLYAMRNAKIGKLCIKGVLDEQSAVALVGPSVFYKKLVMDYYENVCVDKEVVERINQLKI